MLLALRPRPADPRIHADSYPPEPWVEELYRENAASARVRWEPYVYWRRLLFRGKHINIDERGLRRTWRLPGSGGPRLKIFFFGASTAWGTGVRDDHTIPSELARYLAASGVPAEVTNFGETGYVSTQEAIALLRELQRGEVPDLAVFYLGINDTWSALQNGEAGKPQNESHRERELNLLVRARRLAREAIPLFAARSALLRLCGLAFPSRPPAPLVPPGPRLVDGLLRVVEVNRRMVDGLAAGYGFCANFFWEPNLFEKTRRTPYEEARTVPVAGTRGWFLTAYERARREWAAGDAGELTYLGDLFAGTAEPRFLDFSHTGETANREIAAAIGRQLQAHDRLRPRLPASLRASRAGG